MHFKVCQYVTKLITAANHDSTSFFKYSIAWRAYFLPNGNDFRTPDLSWSGVLFLQSNCTLTFLSKEFVQILCRSQEIDLNLIALGDAKEIFTVFISVVEIITNHTEAVYHDAGHHIYQILLKITPSINLFLSFSLNVSGGTLRYEVR